MEHKTSIQIEYSTLEELKSLRLIERETYNGVIIRLIKNMREIDNGR